MCSTATAWRSSSQMAPTGSKASVPALPRRFRGFASPQARPPARDVIVGGTLFTGNASGHLTVDPESRLKRLSQCALTTEPGNVHDVKPCSHRHADRFNLRGQEAHATTDQPIPVLRLVARATDRRPPRLR